MQLCGWSHEAARRGMQASRIIFRRARHGGLDQGIIILPPLFSSPWVSVYSWTENQWKRHVILRERASSRSGDVGLFKMGSARSTRNQQPARRLWRIDYRSSSKPTGSFFHEKYGSTRSREICLFSSISSSLWMCISLCFSLIHSLFVCSFVLARAFRKFQDHSRYPAASSLARFTTM
jgi:hypothetical protein